jgi:hypothetical protein
MDTLVLLDREIGIVGLLELLSRHPDEARMNIHERCHRLVLLSTDRSLSPSPRSDDGVGRRIGHRSFDRSGPPGEPQIAVDPVLHSRPHGSDREE